MDPVTARKTWRTLEPLHGLIYFAPEATEEYAAIGLVPEVGGYFASRAAPMGAVPAEVVIATFFNFRPQVVHDEIPRAWSLASPDTIVDARFRAASRALRKRPRRGRGRAGRERGRGARAPGGTSRPPITSPADRCSRVMRRSIGPTIRSSSSGTRRACCASSAATVTSPR